MGHGRHEPRERSSCRSHSTEVFETPGYYNFPPYYNFGSDLLYFDLEQNSNFPFTGQLRVYSTNGTKAGTSAFDIATDVNNLTTALDRGQAAQFGGKFLIFDQYTAVVGKPATAEFLVTDGTKAGTTTFTITGDPVPPIGLSFNPGRFFSLGDPGSVRSNRRHWLEQPLGLERHGERDRAARRERRRQRTFYRSSSGRTGA